MLVFLYFTLVPIYEISNKKYEINFTLKSKETTYFFHRMNEINPGSIIFAKTNPLVSLCASDMYPQPDSKIAKWDVNNFTFDAPFAVNDEGTLIYGLKNTKSIRSKNYSILLIETDSELKTIYFCVKNNTTKIIKASIIVNGILLFI